MQIKEMHYVIAFNSTLFIIMNKAPIDAFCFVKINKIYLILLA